VDHALQPASPNLQPSRWKTPAQSGGLVCRPLPTGGPGQAGEMAREAIAEGADLILVLGGDGTVNEVLQGMVFSGVPLGVLPGGTANCLAMELGLGSRIERAAEVLAKSEPVNVSVGRITGARYFLLMCGAGLDAAIVEEVHSGLKAIGGKLAYWVAGLAQFRRNVAGMHLNVNGEPIACGFALISRIRNYGGDMEIASDASLRKSDFEVVAFEGANPLRYAWYMLAVALRQVQKLKGVKTRRATSVEILTPAPSQVDGEYYGRETLKVEAIPGALTLLIPPTYG
jgi:diacylglycerol kinase (ATP)